MHETRERAAGEILESRRPIHTASNSYSRNFPAVAAVTATVLQGYRMVNRKFSSWTGWKQAPNPQHIIFFVYPC